MHAKHAKNKGVSFWSFVRKNSLTIFLCAYFVYMEIIYKLFTNAVSAVGLIVPSLFAIVTGLVISGICCCFPRKVSIVIADILTFIVSFFFMMQITYSNWFKTPVSIRSAVAGVGKLVESFGISILNAIWEMKIPLLCMLIPYFFFVIFCRKTLNFEKRSFIAFIVNIVIAAVVCTSTIGGIYLYGTQTNSPWDLYRNMSSLDMGVNKLGIICSTGVDVRIALFGSDDEGEVKIDDEPVVDPDIEEEESQTEDDDTPEEEKVVYEPNVMNFDFKALADAETDTNISELHNYFANQTPSYKNEYTGMFEGYNLIMLTCEGFSPMAVDENITPTLYKLTHNGFVFNNFYTPIWNVSTSDGEYVACTGLYPKPGVWSFERSGTQKNDMMFCLGNVFGNLGYSTNAYHDHDYEYYGRNFSHPNMGYDFKGIGNGLNIPVIWPESDVDMMEASVPEYINNDKFHAYYMTVSGHLEYNFGGNNMARRNEDAVQGLDLPDACKAYLACNVELDKAMANLIAQLEDAGKLDKTVIVMSADHYPYGLTTEQISAFLGHPVDTEFELYKNHLVIWNSAMEENVIVDKYCSSIDILPTVLNLFGCEYDSRLLAGRDILSTSNNFVIFNDGSFITNKCMYNSQTGDVTNLTDAEVDDAYILGMQTVAANRRKVSAAILTYNYYSYLR